MARIQVKAGRRVGAHAARPLTFVAVIAAACSACGGGGGRGAVVAAHSTPAAIVSDWIHQVASGNFEGYCQAEADPAERAGRDGVCKSDQAKKALDAYHGNFVIDGIKPRSPIRVTAARVTGSNATVSGSDVRVGTGSLDSLVTAHSTGIKPGQLTWTFKLKRINGAWYVRAVDIIIN
jgi:hypothetical protein